MGSFPGISASFAPLCLDRGEFRERNEDIPSVIFPGFFMEPVENRGRIFLKLYGEIEAVEKEGRRGIGHPLAEKASQVARAGFMGGGCRTEGSAAAYREKREKQG